MTRPYSAHFGSDEETERLMEIAEVLNNPQITPKVKIGVLVHTCGVSRDAAKELLKYVESETPQVKNINVATPRVSDGMRASLGAGDENSFARS